MKIAHITTYISPDGAFGGPARVAMTQAEALADLGHEVTVYAAAPTSEPSTLRQNGFTIKTFPAKRIHRKLGFAGMYAPELIAQLRADLVDVDVAHIHLARDLVTLPATRLIRKHRIPYFLQPHGMIDPSSNLLAIPIDAWETRRALRGAARIFALTREEVDGVLKVEPRSRLSRLNNGIKIGTLPPYDDRERNVVFLGRIHSIKRPIAFIEMASLIAAEDGGVRFTVAGPDEGELHSLVSSIRSRRLENVVRYIGPVAPERTDNLLRSAAVYVLPSKSEVFPMSVIESIRSGTPTVITDGFGIAAACKEYDAAIVTDGTPRALAESVLRILRDPNLAERLRLGGLRWLSENLDIAEVARRLEKTYQEALKHV